MTNKVTAKERKNMVAITLREGEIKFLDRKVDKSKEEFSSRSAIIRLLINRAMVYPKLLDLSCHFD